MMYAMLVAWGLLTASMAAHPPEVKTYPRLDDVLGHFMYPGVQVTVTWQPCGHVNAFYLPRLRAVVMCEELIDNPAARFFFAHEMAHAVIHQLGIPFTVSEEGAADELAAMVMVLAGHEKDVEAAADWFATKYVEGYRVHPLDDHPDHLKRALTLKCLSLGRAGVPLGCPRNWNHLIWSWSRLLPEWGE